MDRPKYLASFNFNWDVLDVIIGGTSSIDAENYLSQLKTKDEVVKFLWGYGFDVTDPVQAAELFGYFQEAIQFIKRYFLKEGTAEGLDVVIPNTIFMVTDVVNLFLMVTGGGGKKTSLEETIWAGILLKVMHTIIHADKDLRHRYFPTIQKQVLDRFYRFLHRDDHNNLFLVNELDETKIPLHDFQTKAKKMRDSTIIKLLHKRENVAEELFDRIGVRIVTHTRIDTLRVVKFLSDNYVVAVNNVKPSRSHNNLVEMKKFRSLFSQLLKEAIRGRWSEEEFLREGEKLVISCQPEGEISEHQNLHSLDEYKSIHFTCRQLIKYKSPFIKDFSKIRSLAKNDQSELAKLVLSMDTSTVANDVNFFYPFEVQVTDLDSYIKNTEGEASHQEYKKHQLHYAMVRLFKPLISYKDLKVDPINYQNS